MYTIHITKQIDKYLSVCVYCWNGRLHSTAWRYCM